MNRSVIQCLLIVLAANFNVACRSELGSAPKSEDIVVHDDFARQTSSIGLICPSYALVFLIGSSESASTISDWNIAIPSRSDIEKSITESANKFKAAIEKAKSDLMEAFARDPKCTNPFELIFASVIDGPNALDSSIETTHFSMNAKVGSQIQTWKKSNTKTWTLDDGKLVPKVSVFELNMAQDVGTITQILAKSSAQEIATSNSLKLGQAIIPGQIHYILKTHGARIATDSTYQPTLENLKMYPRKDIMKSQWQSAILMDTHGSNARLSSSVFSAHWNPADISAALHDTAGDGSLDDNLSGDGRFDTAGEVGSTSGSKSLSYQEPLITQSTPDYLGKQILGSFATYAGNATSIGEEAQLRLPVGNERNGGKNLIILDSCYASEGILNALEYGDGMQGKTLVLASVNELYFEFFDYSKLDLAGFLKMPLLLEKLKSSTNLTSDEKALLADMSKGTLDWQNKNSKSAFKELAIWND